MKTIELKTVTEEIFSGQGKKPVEIKTIDLIKTAVNNTPPGGFAFTDMLNRLRIGDAVDKLEKMDASEPAVLHLEDADFENLKKYVHDTKWAIVSRTIVEFVMTLDEMK